MLTKPHWAFTLAAEIRALWLVLMLLPILLQAACSDNQSPDRSREVADLTEFEVPRGPDLSPRRLALGSNATVGVKEDGSVWGWGLSLHGELSAERRGVSFAEPAPIGGIRDVVEVSGGSQHFMALERDGSVYAWGSNKYGQLGYSTEEDYSATPRKVSGLENIISIGAGSSHSVALDSSGRIYGFGLSDGGVLGDPDTDLSSGKVPVSAITLVGKVPGAVRIFAGTSNNAVITEDGSIWFIGSNSMGEIGCAAGSKMWINRFAKCDGVTASSVALGIATTYLLDGRGKVYAMGFNSGGQLGKGYRDANRNIALERVPGIGSAVAIASSGSAAYAIDERGRLWSWGESAGGPSIAGFARKDWLTAGFVARLDSPVALVGGWGLGAALLADGRTLFFGKAAGTVRGTGKRIEKDTEESWLTPEVSLWRWK